MLPRLNMTTISAIFAVRFSGALACCTWYRIAKRLVESKASKSSRVAGSASGAVSRSASAVVSLCWE